jgi:hypothetical protein
MFCLESDIFLGAWTYARFLDFCIIRVFMCFSGHGTNNSYSILNPEDV